MCLQQADCWCCPLLGLLLVLGEEIGLQGTSPSPRGRGRQVSLAVRRPPGFGGTSVLWFQAVLLCSGFLCVTLQSSTHQQRSSPSDAIRINPPVCLFIGVLSRKGKKGGHSSSIQNEKQREASLCYCAILARVGSKGKYQQEAKVVQGMCQPEGQERLRSTHSL